MARRVFSPRGAPCTLQYVTARPWRLCLTAISACPMGSPPGGEPSATMRCCRRGEHPLVRKHGWVGCIVGRSRQLVRYAVSRSRDLDSRPEIADSRVLDTTRGRRTRDAISRREGRK